jgi:hypothetical protein
MRECGPSRRYVMSDALSEVLDRIEAYLDNLSDCEGNGPADANPNEEMRLLCDLRAARQKEGV